MVSTTRVFDRLGRTGRQLTLLLPKPARGAPSTRLVSMAGYGVAFAMAGEIQSTLVGWVDAIGPVPLVAALVTDGVLLARRRVRAGVRCQD